MSFPELFQGAKQRFGIPLPGGFCMFFANLKLDKGKQAAFQNKAFGTW